MKKTKKANQEPDSSNSAKEYKLKRIDKDYVLHEIGSVLNFDKGLFYTMRELLFRPGKTIRVFISEDRNRLIKPVVFLILSSLIYSIMMQFFQFKDGYIDVSSSEENAITELFNWLQNNYGFANLIMGVFIALWIKLLFRKYDYNFFEILILLCFTMGFGMLIISVFGLIEGITSLKTIKIGGVITPIYISWAIGQFFDKRRKINYLKSFLSYFLGMITFLITLVALGLLIDTIK